MILECLCTAAESQPIKVTLYGKKGSDFVVVDLVLGCLPQLLPEYLGLHALDERGLGRGLWVDREKVKN